MGHTSAGSSQGQWTRFALVLVALVGCEADAVGWYSSERDDVAMAAIASDWSAPSGLVISLCEDVARSAAWAGPDGCNVDHVVRGGGLGLDHVERHDVRPGCGGCSYQVKAWVLGSVSGPGLTGTVPVSGYVELQSSLDEDPYGFPYTIRLACDETVQVCSVTGSLEATGGIAATLVLGPTGPGQAETQHSLTRLGAAVCP
jgi:hypothetical protein